MFGNYVDSLNLGKRNLEAKKKTVKRNSRLVLGKIHETIDVCGHKKGNIAS